MKSVMALPKRWIEQRTLGWIGHYRQYSKDHEQNTTPNEAMIHITVTHVML